MSVDSVLNALIVPIILCGVGWIFREPIKALFGLIKDFIDKRKGDGEDGGITNGFGNIEYE